jgi:hypothetical protein
MKIQEMLTQLKDYRDACTNTELDCLRIDAQAFALWAYTLEQHLASIVDGQPDRRDVSESPLKACD